MTEDIDVNDQPTEQLPSESETLRKRADFLGITYHPSIGVEKLKAKIAEKLGADEQKVEVSKSNEKPPIVEFLTAAEFDRLRLRNRRKNAGSLVRIRLVCMNPNKKDWEGEIFSTGSAKIGTYKKYVPFNTENGWHVPQMMLDMIRERKCSVFSNVRGPKGEKIRKARLVPEFSIEVLPPLNQEELSDLAQQQAMSHNID